MIIMSGANDKYGHFVEGWIKSVEANGYEYRLYDFGGLGQGIPVKKVTGKTPKTVSDIYKSKPRCLYDALAATKQTVVWTDIDARVVNKIPDPGDFDIGFLGKYRHDKVVKLKTGIVMVRPTFGAEVFMAEWIADGLGPDVRHEQHWLQRYARKHASLKKRDIGTVVTMNGIWVRLLDGSYLHELYNLEDCDRIPPDVKTIHFTGDYSLDPKDKNPMKEKIFERIKQAGSFS